MAITVFPLVSPLHNPEELARNSKPFMDEIIAGTEDELIVKSWDEYGQDPFDLPLIMVQTGGTERLFMDHCAKRNGPFYLLASGNNNSLAAAIEISSYLRHHGESCEIIHGPVTYITRRLNRLTRSRNAHRALRGVKLGVIGAPSDWLIGSFSDYLQIKNRIGIELVDIPMKELVEEIEKNSYPEEILSTIRPIPDNLDAQKSLAIYGALRRIVDKYNLNGLTLRCFDLLTKVHGTGCLALAILNREGILSGCEGDIPALISMAIANTLTGQPLFQANPSFIDLDKNEILVAHCSAPLDMFPGYSYDTHFESGMGVAIKAVIEPGDPVTIFKTAGDLRSFFVSQGVVMPHDFSPQLCRTQIAIRPDENVRYFLENSIGNHHVLLRGRHTELIEDFFATL